MAPMGLLQRIWRRGLHLIIINYIIFGLFNFLPTLADRQAYRTAYGCEGARLSITCDPGHVINVIRANYGRFSITICNNHGNTEWSVNCQSPRTHRVLADRCSGEGSCEVNVSSESFGDPCPGTFKYIEVHYTCGLATTSTTTARPRPPWFIGTREPVWLPPSINSSLVTAVPSHENFSSTSVKSTSSSVPITTSTTTTVATTSTTITSAASTTTTTSMTTLRLSSVPADDVDDKEEENLNRTNSGEFSSSSHRPSITPHVPLKALPATPPSFGSGITYDTPWCAPSFARGLYWNWTKAGEKAELACPGGATGLARRKCLVGEWDGPADLSDCRSAWLTALKKRARPNTQDSVLAVATDLAKVTASKALYGGDLITAAQLIKTLSRRMMQDVTTAFPEPHQRQALITEFLLAALDTGSALLSAGMVGPWGDLSSKERRFAVTELMVGLEEATFLLGDVLPEGTQSTLYKSHVLASVRAVSPDGTSVKFPSAEDESLDWVFTDTVVLPPEVMFENTEGSVTRIVFLAYRHLEDLLSPHDNTLGRQGRKNVSRIVNSRVVSASLGHGRHIQLSELSKPVTLTLSLLRHDNVSNPICAFWDYSTYDWSDEGCYTHSFNRTHVTCKCDHLTNFAVIMEESSGIDVQETISPIRILAFVGCLICVVCVAGSILMFTLFKGISSPRTFIQRHVCICLLVAELVFLIGVWRTDLPILCGVVAGVLHYFILAAFAWMFIEGIHVYLSMTKPVDSDCSYLHWWHYVLAYGVPLLVVCGAAVVDPFSFGTPDFCWLRTDNYFIFSLVGPALILVAIQVVLLGMTLLRTCMFNPDETLKTKEMARLASSRSWLRSAMVILLLMVLNWTLGLLLLHQPSIALAAAFCTFNSLHGVFIFVYYCIRNQKVREWCGSSEQGGRSTWIPRMFRNVFATDKQTYSPNNNNNMTANSSLPPDSSSSSTSSPHHQAISQALNQALSAGPNVQQYLPTLAHVGTMKGHANHPQSPPPFLEGTSMLGSRGSLRQMGSVGCPFPMGSLHQSLQRRHHSHPHYLDSINTSTITTPVITTATHLGPTTSLSAPMIDEDVSYKSFSRDSGHGGSEQEDSPRTQWTGQHHRFCNNDMRTSYVTKMNTLNQTKVDPNIACSYSVSPSPNTVTPSIAAILRAGGGPRANSPWNHTYMEIESDPVYEEIERERWARAGVGGSEVMQVSDLSDEDLKRGTPSDVSRQSSRSYGDSHPLLPYLQHPVRQSKESQFALSEERLRDFNAAQMSRDLEHLQQVQQHLSRENLMTVAVLNGEQVVCRLSSPSHPVGPQNLSIIHEGNRAHSAAPSPTSNGYPSHFVVSRPHMIHCNDFNEC